MRQSNFELLRIVSIMMIQAMHIVGVVHNNENISFLNVQVESFVNCFCNVGVTCFILISGWFGIQRKTEKLLELLIIAIVYSIICSSVTNEWSLLNTIVVPSWHVLSLDNWFLGCYIVVTLIAPWLNTIAETFSREQFRSLLLTLVFILGVVTTLFHSPNGSVIYWGGKSLGWFTTTYLIGRYLRLYYKNGLDINMSVKMIVVPLFIMYGFCFLVSSLPAPFNDRHGYLTRDSSPLMLIEAIGVFFLFNSFRIKSRLINWSASSAFALYLLGGYFSAGQVHIPCERQCT